MDTPRKIEGHSLNFLKKGIHNEIRRKDLMTKAVLGAIKKGVNYEASHREKINYALIKVKVETLFWLEADR